MVSMLIGLTGGIGSGKSTIAKALEGMGYPVYDTDSRAKALIMQDGDVHRQVEELLGSHVFAGGQYQTSMVAQMVFACPQKLAQLNAIVHPAVRADVAAWKSQQQVQGHTLCFVESAILYQSHLDEVCDGVVAVTAPEEIRVQRILARDHTTIDKARARIRAQETEKDEKKADLVINNDGNAEILHLCLQIRDFFCIFAG